MTGHAKTSAFTEAVFVAFASRGGPRVLTGPAVSLLVTKLELGSAKS